jgi:hypothetical protein
MSCAPQADWKTTWSSSEESRRLFKALLDHLYNEGCIIISSGHVRVLHPDDRNGDRHAGGGVQVRPCQAGFDELSEVLVGITRIANAVAKRLCSWLTHGKWNRQSTNGRPPSHGSPRACSLFLHLRRIPTRLLSSAFERTTTRRLSRNSRLWLARMHLLFQQSILLHFVANLLNLFINLR